MWASDDPNFFGTRVGAHDNAKRIRTVVPLSVTARYLTLKSYHSGDTLRIDAFRAYGTPVPLSVTARYLTTKSYHSEDTLRADAFRADDTPSEAEKTPELPPIPLPIQESSSPRRLQEKIHWWNRVETHRGNLYPLRGPPDVDVASPASSLAMAMSLRPKRPNAWLGHNATLPPLCVMLNCTIGNSLTIYEIDIGRYPFHVSVRDDFANAVWLLSAAIEPVVHLVSTVALRCASPDLCEGSCDLCPLQAKGAADAEDVIVAVETELAGGDDSSADLTACLVDVQCIDDAAQRAARRVGTMHALPPPDMLYAVVEANRVLIDGFVEETRSSNPFNTTLYERHRLARAHAKAVALDPPTWRGRRLEQTEETHGMLKAHVQVNAMRLLSSITCDKLKDGDYKLALEARMNATRQWSSLGGGGNSKTSVSTQWCWDCELNRTIGCETHFMLVGRALQILRQKRDQENAVPSRDERRKLVEESVRKQAQQLCCARFTDGREDECHPKYCSHVFRDVLLKRIGHVGRKLHETKHPSADRLGVDARVSVDTIHPEGHPDEGCRRPNRSQYGITDYECFAKSMIHHLGEKHGFSADMVKKKAQQLGFDLGEGFQTMMRFFGRHTEKKASGDVRPDSPHGRGRRTNDKAAADAQAEKLLRRSKTITSSTGRRLQETRKRTQPVDTLHSLGHLINSTEETVHGFHRVERRMVEQKREQNTRNGRAPPRSRPIAEPGSLLSGIKRFTTFLSPKALTMAVEQTEGSLVSRFAPGFEKVEAAMKRHREYYNTIVQEREQRHRERSRRLEAKRAAAPHSYQDVLRVLEERHRTRRPKRGTFEIDKEHALSWVHEIVDFRDLYKQTRRVVDVETERSKLRSQGLGWEYIVDRHPTGFDTTDSPTYRPSKVGDFLRRLHSRMTLGKDPEWHGKERRDAGRRLSEGFLSGVLDAPYAFSDTFIPTRGTVPASQEPFYEAGVRYLVYSTIGCYLTPPVNAKPDTLEHVDDEGSEGVLSDGDPAGVLRPSASKLCFPGIPFVYGRWPTFRDLTGTHGVDFRELTYERFCTHDGFVQQTAREMESFGIVQNASVLEIPGQAAPLRLAEAADSINNIVKSSNAKTPYEASGLLMCSIVEAGGILYSLVLIFGVLILLMFLTCANWLGSFVADLFCVTAAFSSSRKNVTTDKILPPESNTLPVSAPRVIPVSRARFGTRVATSGFFTTVLSTVVGGNTSSSDEEERLVSREV